MLDSTNKLVETLDLDVSYGTYLDPHPGPGSVPLTTSHRRRAVLLPGPSWTDFKWKWNKDHRVHFICHSQGGNTVRQLVSLMANGAGGLHDQYFATTGRDEWTISVTTLGTPHKGSTITNVLENLLSVCLELTQPHSSVANQLALRRKPILRHPAWWADCSPHCLSKNLRSGPMTCNWTTGESAA